MDRTMTGPGLVGAGLKGMLKLGSQPVRKGIKAVTSFASAVDAEAADKIISGMSQEWFDTIVG